MGAGCVLVRCVVQECGSETVLGPGEGDSGRFRLVVWERAGDRAMPGGRYFWFL